MGTEGADWAALKRIEALPSGELGAHRELIERVAQQLGVARSDDLAALVAKERAAIKQGSARLMGAIGAAQAAYAAGDRDGAKGILRDALAGEPISYYREILTAELARRS